MSWNCQKCRQPLRIDDSIASLWDDIVSASLASHPSTSSAPTHSASGGRAPVPLPDMSRVPPSLRPLYSAATAPRINYSKQPERVMVQAPGPAIHQHPTPPPLGSPSLRDFPLPSATVKKTSHLGPSDSFVVLTESVIEPARTAVPPRSSSDDTSNDGQSGKPLASASPNGAVGSGDVDGSGATPLTPHLTQLRNLYALVADKTGVEQPLCLECMDALVNLMGKELDERKKERDRLVAFEREIARKREETPVSRDDLAREIAKWQKKEREASDELKALEADRSTLEAEERALDETEAALAMEEATFWADYSGHLLAQESVRDEQTSLAARHAHATRELERLARANVYNDAFCIGHEAGFGTINKLRLGRLPGTPVDWPEINAAWGHTLLLLHTLARKFSFSFETYKLIPIGSFSRVEKLGPDKAVYELYGSGDFNAVTRLMQNRRFDQAMVAFLDCLRQLMDHVRKLDKSIKLPHAVVKDKIGDVSIKYQFGSDEAWTRALRHVLFDLKILLGRASA